MVSFEVNGVDVEFEGVKEEDLPRGFDLDGLLKMVETGSTVDEMCEYVHAQSWVQSRRRILFWNEWEAVRDC